MTNHNVPANDTSPPSSANEIGSTTQPQLLSGNPNSPFVTLVQEVFGGKMKTCYKCNKCQSLSVHTEVFTDIHLAVPDQKSKGTSQSSSSPLLNMQQLVRNYLEPETLEDENKYHCDKCEGLQDAVKSIYILEGPQYLMCTLMRFKYDCNVKRKSKVTKIIKKTWGKKLCKDLILTYLLN